MSDDITTLEAQVYRAIKTHNDWYGDAGWTDTAALVETCDTPTVSKTSRERRIRLALSNLLKRGVIRRQVPANDPGNEIYQCCNPLDYFTEGLRESPDR